MHERRHSYQLAHSNNAAGRHDAPVLAKCSDLRAPRASSAAMGLSERIILPGRHLRRCAGGVDLRATALLAKNCQR